MIWRSDRTSLEKKNNVKRVYWLKVGKGRHRLLPAGERIAVLATVIMSSDEAWFFDFGFDNDISEDSEELDFQDVTGLP